MEIEREDYREPNRTKPLLAMFTEWHTEASRNYGQMAYRTECRITLPEAYQITTEKPTDILPKLPTELTGKVYQVDQDSLKHRRYWNQPPPEDFHRGRRIRGRRLHEKITGKDHRKRSWEKREVNQDIHRDAHRPQRCPPRSIYLPMPMATEVFNGACGYTVRGLGRAQAHLNTW
jgi:hypothetical protein